MSPRGAFCMSRNKEEAPWEQGQLTRLVVNENPRRFLAALDAQIAAGRNEPRAWSTFLGQVGQGEDDRLALATARTLLRMSDADLKAIDQQAAWWLEQQYHRRRREKAKWPKAMDDVRERLINVVYTADGPAEHVAPRDQDRALLATAAGALATVTLGEVLRRKRVNTPAKKAALDALQRLTDCGGESGTIALMACARQLSRLHYLAPEWCERVVTPRMLPLTPVAAALWRARSSDGHPGLPSLVRLTKDRLMHAILNDCVSDHEEHNLFVLLLLSCAWRMRGSIPDQPVMPADVKHVLRRSKPELRRHLLWLLWRWLDAARDERAEAWRKHYGPLFESVWPLDARLQDGESTRGLIDIAYASGDAFPEAVRAVLPFVTPVDGRRSQSVFRLRKDEDRVVERFPEDVLELLDMMIREPSHVPYELDRLLDEVVAARANLERDPRHRRLRRLIAASRA